MAKHCIIFLVVSVTVLLGNALAAFETKPFPPPPQNTDPSWELFSQQLIRAIEERDEQYILSIISDDCEVSYGGFSGVRDFEDYWFGHASHGKDFFAELSKAMEIGGMVVESGEGYAVPYTTMAPAVDENGVMLGVLIAPTINIRATPGLKGRRITTLGYEVVRLCNIKVPIAVDDMEWTCVLLPEGGRGYAASQHIASPLGQRFLFRKIKGQWKLVSTVAGQ